MEATAPFTPSESSPLAPWRRLRVEDLFHRALELPPEERGPFLDRRCEGDGPLRAEVESLLEALDATGILGDETATDPMGFNSSSCLEPATEVAGTPSSGAASGSTFAGGESPSFPERLGPYRLLEVLGEGGMSTVYLAEQSEPLPRRVALKLMRWGGARGQALRRFELERQALARMSHPNIAQVFGAGASEHGQPYVVIEHVPGPPITEYCDRKNLSLEERLELFAAVCDGVRHAHEKAIIHRDLKPSNILVAEVQGRPLPKIIDFGIAKSLEPWSDSAAQKTLSRMRVGSPGYMSPEAIRSGGEAVDTRSDVYSLGVVLCQLLVGVRPFDLPTAWIFPAVCGGKIVEPAPPSRRFEGLESSRRRKIAGRRRIAEGRLVRRLRGELDWVVLRAVAHDPAERYGSPAELAADVRAWLDGRPIDAKPPSFIYRARKAVRRHWVACATAALVAAVVCGFSVRHRLLYERAELARDQSEELVAFMLEDLGSQLEAKGHLDVMESVAKRSLTYFESEAGRSEQAGRRPAVALRQIGEVFAARGDLDAALQAYGLALDADRRRNRQHPGEPSAVLDVARDLKLLGMILELLGSREAAASRLAEAERLLRRLVDEHPRLRVEATVLLAEVLKETVPVHSGSGRIDLATAASDEALGLIRKLAEGHPNDLEILRLLGELHYWAGHHASYWRDEAEIAVREFEAGAAIFRRLLENRPKAATWRYRLAVIEGQGLTDAYLQLGRSDEARVVNRRALQTFEQLVRQEPGHGRWTFGFSWELIRSGDLAREDQDLEGAEAAFNRSADLLSALIERTPGTTDDGWLDALAIAHRSLADVQAERGDTAAALESAEAARGVRRRLLERSVDPAYDHVRSASVAVLVGDLRRRLGDPAGAREAVREAGALFEILGRLEIVEPYVREELVVVRERLDRLGAELGAPVAGVAETVGSSGTLPIDSPHPSTTRR